MPQSMQEAFGECQCTAPAARRPKPPRATDNLNVTFWLHALAALGGACSCAPARPATRPGIRQVLSARRPSALRGKVAGREPLRHHYHFATAWLPNVQPLFKFRRVAPKWIRRLA